MNWYRETFLAAGREPGRLPLSFLLGEQPSSGFEEWSTQITETAGDDAQALLHALNLLQPGAGLSLRCEVREFTDFPAVDWVAHLANSGDSDTPILSDIFALDTVFSAAKEATCTLHHAKGSECKINDFEPLATPLGLEGRVELSPVLGRSSNGVLPFFNLDLGANADGQPHGVIIAIGWTGGWKAIFERDAEGAVRVRAGMEKTHLKLQPGEEIRTPRILLLFWQGERLHGHNMLRALILRHYTPRPNGELAKTPISSAVWGENYAQNQIAKAHWWRDNDIPIDTFWIDAGWHGDGAFLENSTVFNSDWGKHVGNWWPNKTTYPEGLKPIGDTLKDLGLGFVLWLEPERVFKETYFTREHPEWLLGPVGDNCLYDLGNPEACQFLTDLVSDLIAEGGVTCYRQDFNMEIAPFWEANDAPDRVGMSEIRHIEGLYRFWDDLLERNPGLLIDNCSSGGRRIDLEMTMRSIPLWRSDFQCYPEFDPLSQQNQTHGLGLWLPLSTGSCDRVSDYAFRSALGPGITICTSIYEQEPQKYFPVDWMRKRVEEQVAVREYFYGDFYPLLSWSLATDTWAAWQFDRPDLGEGMILAMRRQDSPFTQMRAVLQGLDPNATYEVESKDTGQVYAESGGLLMENGLTVEIGDKPGSALLVYRRM
jgi:alpha-galactosidase